MSASATSGASGTILSATATDNVGVVRVEFLVDGASKGSDTSSPYSLTLAVGALSVGAHSLIAVAYDAAGNSAQSSAVSFTVPDAVPPTVTASVSVSKGQVTMRATASDNDAVARVEFRVDGTLIGTDTTAEYLLKVKSTTWPRGTTHSLVVRAFDRSGNSSNSTAVSFQN